MIRIENLSVSYKETLALKDISLVLQGPTITGIIGPNGAGKSTLLKGMLGIIPHEGHAFIEDKEMKKSLQLPYQGKRMCLSGTLSIHSTLSHFKSKPLAKGG